MHFLRGCVHNEYVRNIHPRTLVLIGILITLAIVLLGVAIKLSGGNPKNLIPGTLKPTPTIEKTASITFSPTTVTVASGSGTADIIATTGKNPITGVQVELVYDPTVITNVKLLPADTTTSLFGAPGTYTNLFTDDQPGNLTFAVAISLSSENVSGSGSIGKITFDTIPGAKTETQITLGPKTIVTSTATDGSILNTSTPLTVKLQ